MPFLALERMRARWSSGSVGTITVDLASCVRCAACSILAPRVFAVTRKGTRVIAEPAAGDRAAVAAAVLACPMQAIREADHG